MKLTNSELFTQLIFHESIEMSDLSFTQIVSDDDDEYYH